MSHESEFCLHPGTNSWPEDVHQRALLSSWAKKYVVVEIPPYCRQRGGAEDGETDGSTEDVFIFPGPERTSGEAMDCSGSLEREDERGRVTRACPM